MDNKEENKLLNSPPKVQVCFILLDTIPEIQMLQLLMEASQRFDEQLSKQEKGRVINYFKTWYDQTNSTGK